MARTLKVRPRYYRWHVDPGVEWLEANTGYGYLDWEVPISQAALVLVDVWDGHYLKEASERSEEIVRNRIVPLVSACRAAGMQLIHAPAPGLAEEHPARVRLADRDGVTAARRDDWPPQGFRSKTGEFEAFARPEEPREKELVARRSKRRMHPLVQAEGSEVVILNGEELHLYCKQEGILFLFFLGFNTNACILLRDYGTIEMHKRGYEVIIVRDCGTAMESFESQEGLWQTRGTIQFLEMFQKSSVASEELIAGLSAQG